MNEKEANIDLLFRNGLKDFEVLPPPGVCDNILSAVRIKSKSYIFLRIAAAITVLLTISFLTYRWNRELSPVPQGSVIAFNVKVSSPVFYNPIDNSQFLREKKINPAISSSVVLAALENQTVVYNEIEETASPEQIMNVPETRNLYLTKNETFYGLELKQLNTPQENSIKIQYPDLQYPTVNTIAKPVKRWSIAALASPTYYSSFNSGNEQLNGQVTSPEEPLFSYSGGVAFSYKISKRFSIQSGIYYSSLGQKVDGIYSFSGFQKYNNSKGGPNFIVPTTSGTVYANNPDVFLTAYGNGKVLTAYNNDVFDPKKASLQYISNSLTQNLSYLELPVIVRYKVIDKMIGVNLVGGLSYNLLVNNSAYAMKDGSKYSVGDTKGLNPLALSSSLGLGMEYNLSDKLSLNIEPTFRYYLNPFSVATGSFIHPYSIGVFSGVSYKF
ncbi:MAG: outer membrane beta-barrel protein [Bacteroidales bacterium]